MLHSVNLFISSLLNSPIKRLFFAIFTGLLFSITLPFIGLGFYAWLGLVPLCILVKSSSNFKSLLWESFAFFFAYNSISFMWLLGLHPLTWQGLTQFESISISALAWLLPSIFHSFILLVFILILKLFYEYRTSTRSYELNVFDITILAFIWVVIEHKFLLSLGPDLGVFSVPINLLAYSQYQNQILIQFANQVGTIGIEFLLIVVNLAFSNFFNIHQFSGSGIFKSSELNIKQPFFGLQKANEHLRVFVVLILAFIAIFAYGFLELEKAAVFTLKNQNMFKTFAIVQADYSAASSRSNVPNPDNLLALQYQLSSKLTKPVNLLLWSEGSVPLLDKSAYQASTFINFNKLSDIFIYGTFSRGPEGEYFNSIDFMEFDPIKKENYAIKKYHKRKLVQFGEYVPFFGILPGPLKRLANSTVGEGFSIAPKGPVITETGILKFAANICFELLFPKLVRKQVLEGGQVIVNLNDLSWFNNWFKGDWIKKQFLAVAVFRAVENKRDLLLAGNSGHSALITAYGKILYATEAHKIQISQGSFMPRDEKSNYTLYGW